MFDKFRLKDVLVDNQRARPSDGICIKRVGK